jgi:hypothetical protein
VDYRLYFFDVKRRIHSVAELEAADDEAAIAAAQAIFEQRQAFPRAELWRRGQIIRTFQR